MHKMDILITVMPMREVTENGAEGTQEAPQLVVEAGLDLAVPLYHGKHAK
jgi:hypothetical protein